MDIVLYRFCGHLAVNQYFHEGGFLFLGEGVVAPPKPPPNPPLYI